MQQKQPIIVTGAHRSGTTFVGKMLALSKRVGYIHEPFNPEGIPGISAPDFNWFAYVTQENEEQYYNHIRRILDFQFDLAGALKMLERKRLIQGSYSTEEVRLVENYARFIRLYHSNSIPLVKDPIALFASEWLAERFNARVIVLIRHPAAFAGSVKKLGWQFQMSTFSGQPLLMRDYLHQFREEIEDFAQAGADVVDCAALAWKCFYYVISQYRLKHSDWIFIRHEDVSRSPVHYFKSIYASMNLKFTPEIEEKIIAHTNAQNPSEWESADQYQSVNLNSIANLENWKKRLTGEEISRIHNRVKEVSGLFYADDEW